MGNRQMRLPDAAELIVYERLLHRAFNAYYPIDLFFPSEDRYSNGKEQDCLYMPGVRV